MKFFLPELDPSLLDEETYGLFEERSNADLQAALNGSNTSPTDGLRIAPGQSAPGYVPAYIVNINPHIFFVKRSIARGVGFEAIAPAEAFELEVSGWGEFLAYDTAKIEEQFVKGIVFSNSEFHAVRGFDMTRPEGPKIRYEINSVSSYDDLFEHRKKRWPFDVFVPTRVARSEGWDCRFFFFDQKLYCSKETNLDQSGLLAGPIVSELKVE